MKKIISLLFAFFLIGIASAETLEEQMNPFLEGLSNISGSAFYPFIVILITIGLVLVVVSIIGLFATLISKLLNP